MTITLVAIVRNESATLPRLIASVRDHITRAVIIDTGSADDTINVARRELVGIPHAIHEREWVNFGHNRTEALALAQGTADYLLLADADHEWVIEPGALDDLTADAYTIPIHETGMVYGFVGIVRADLDWRYEGATHEYLDTTGRDVQRLAGVTIMHHHDGGHRADKLARDLALLDGLTDPRSTYYRAQTLMGLGRNAEAAAEYLRRADMPGWDEETYHALYRAGVLLDDVTILLRAHSARPSRLEALYEAAHRLRAIGAHEAVYRLLLGVNPIEQHTDQLFVEPWVYQYGILFEYALACQNTGRTLPAAAAYAKLAALPTLPDTYRAAIHENTQRLAA